jgi:hypothetical protein
MNVKKISEEVTRRGWHTAQAGNDYFLQDEKGLTIVSAPSLIGLIEKINTVIKSKKS